MSEVSEKAIKLIKDLRRDISIDIMFTPEKNAEDDSLKALVDYIAELEAEATKCHELQDSYCDRIAELEANNDRLQDTWFVEETICPDGSLKPKVSTLLSRIAELEAAQRWIPVSERLPEECTPVLTLSKDNDKPVTAFLDAGFWWSNVDWALNVTHWMPLPKLPEDK